MNRKLQALGRLKSGERNKTEAAFEALLEARKQAGEVLWYAFERIKLGIATNCWLTIDFAVMHKDFTFEMIDVKGSPFVFSDDAKVKMKVAARDFPFAVKVAYPIAKRDGGGWKIEEMAA